MLKSLNTKVWARAIQAEVMEDKKEKRFDKKKLRTVRARLGCVMLILRYCSFPIEL